ncbi:MAG: SCO family protein [Halobacteriovoraceae bacterium]|jgi:protein SCO1|nr:SCO family protein [Halobacteriovoraceae bacterium]
MNSNFRIFLSVLTLVIVTTTIFYLQTRKPEYLGGDFKITSTKGKYNLRQDRGKIVIVYFGYRYCPDVCPTTLSDLAFIKNKLTPPEQDLLQVIFISLDPIRDTIPVLDEYVNFFHSTFIGATSSREKLDHIANLYGVKYKIHKPKDKDQTSYTVDHSAEAFIVGKDGQLKDIIPYGEDVNISIKNIKLYMGEKI